MMIFFMRLYSHPLLLINRKSVTIPAEGLFDHHCTHAIFQVPVTAGSGAGMASDATQPRCFP